MAADEYRVEIDLADEAHGHPLSERLASLDLDDEVEERLGDRVIVTRDGPHLFVYTETREACAEAERVVRDILLDDGLSASVRASRWNASAGEWRDADAPLAEGKGPGPDYAKEAEEEKVPHPLFVYIEGHEPHFLRDLGV